MLDSERDFNDSNHSYALNWIQARPIQERAASLTASSQKRIRATSSKTIISESALVKLAARFFGKKLHRKWVCCDHLKPYKALQSVFQPNGKSSASIGDFQWTYFKSNLSKGSLHWKFSNWPFYSEKLSMRAP